MLAFLPCCLALFVSSLAYIPQGTQQDRALQQSRSKLLDRAFAKAQVAWRTKKYSVGIAWLKPLTSQLDKKPGAKALLTGLHYSQGWREMKAGRPQRARSEFEQASALRPQEKNVWYALGLVSQALKDESAAKRHFERTLRLDPAHFEALLALARIAYEAQGHAKARIYLKRAEKIHPGDPALTLLQELCRRDDVLDQEFKSFESTHFKIRWSGRIPKTSQETRQILAYLELCHRELKTILGQGTTKPTEVVLYSRKEFSALTGVQDWMGAFYDGKVRIPFKSWRQQKKKVQEIMRHELAHAFVEDLLPGASSWVHEGFAQWYQGRRSRGLDQVFRKTRPRSARELRKPFSKVQDSRIVAALYLQSLILMEDLLSRGGTKQVRRLLTETKQAEGGYEAREDRTLMDLQGTGLDAWIQKLAKARSWASPGR